MIGKKINQLATELAPASTDLTIIGNPTTGVSKKITLAQLGAIFSGAVSFYTNLASFPATGTLDVIFCAKDTQKLYLWSGSAYVEVFPSQALLDTYQLRSEKGNANGYASLDSSGKVPVSQLPSSIMEYKGTWSAATNTPTLANGTGDTGDVYICNAAGSVNFGAGAITFAVGDYVIYSGSIWQRSSGAVGTVTSVAASITGNAIGITGSPVTTSGTLALAFAGTSAQYVNGAGNLVTFPSIISQAQNIVSEVYNNTGATLTKGTIVYINGGQGNLPTVTKALATGDSTSAQTYGIVQADITNMNNGYVVVAGRLTDLDTQAYSNGTQLYLSGTTAGTWTSTKPYAPIHLVYVGIVVRSHPTQGVVEVKIQNGYEMDELHNVSAQNPNNGDILQYVSSTSLWTKVAGTTSNIAEGSNLYYTDARSRAALSFTAGSGAYNSTTGVITIPTNTNQLTNGAAYITLASLSAGAGISYNNTTGVIASTITQYTDAMARASISGGTGISYNSTTGVITNTITQYTDAMARASISLTTTGTSGAATYNSTTGVLNVPQYAPDLSGYVPTSRTLTINGTAYDLSANRSWSVGTVTSVGLSSATSGVTIGSTPVTTIGTITLAIATASGSQQGLLSSTDWTTFNNKQSALTNPVTGTGTTNYLPKFTGTSTIGNSIVQESGSSISIAGSASATAFNSDGSTFFGFTLKGRSSDNYGAFGFYSNNGATRYGYLQSHSTNGGQLNVTGDGGGQITLDNQGHKFLLTGVQKMHLDALGNLGLGVTPSAWLNVKAFQIGSTSLGNYSNTGYFNGNAYYASGTGWTYVNSSYAARYELNSSDAGIHAWFTAPSGTAGNAISFTQAMTLNASGNLSIGNTNDTYKLDVSGTGRFTSNIYISGGTNVNTGNGIHMYYESNYAQIQLNGTSTAGSLIDFSTSGTDYLGRIVYRNSTNQFEFNTNGAGTPVLTLSSTGAATFSSSVTAGGKGIFETNTTVGYDGTYTGYASIGLGGTTNGYNRVFGGVGTADGLFLASATGRGIYFRAGGGTTDHVTISSTGNVGIGTTSPGRRLEVYSATSDTRIAITNSISGSGAGAGFELLVNNADAYAYNYMTGHMIFGTSSTERMRITSGGGLWVGTSSRLSTSNSTFKASTASDWAMQIQSPWATAAQNYGLLIDYSGASPNGNGNPFIQCSDSTTTRFVVNSNGNVIANSIKTGNPGLGNAGVIKLGQRFTGTAIGVGGYIPIDIDGTTYYINLATTTP